MGPPDVAPNEPRKREHLCALILGFFSCFAFFTGPPPVLDPAEIARLKASADLVQLFSIDGHDGNREGSRTRVNCPFHVEQTPSCYIFDDGHFKCFGCGATGDAIAYLMRRRGIDFTKACEVLGAAPQRATPAKIDQRRKYEVTMPVPDKAPKLIPTIYARDKQGRPTVGEPQAVWWYLSPTGERLFAVVRYPVLENGQPQLDEDGRPKKTIRTWCWARSNEDGGNRLAVHAPARSSAALRTRSPGRART